MQFIRIDPVTQRHQVLSNFTELPIVLVLQVTLRIASHAPVLRFPEARAGTILEVSLPGPHHAHTFKFADSSTRETIRNRPPERTCKVLDSVYSLTPGVNPKR